MGDAESGRIVRGLYLELDEPEAQLTSRVALKLGIPEQQVSEVRPLKVSIDARGKRPRRVYTVRVWLVGEDIPSMTVPTLDVPPNPGPLIPDRTPLIVGTGPAGLWAALRLLEHGIPSVLVDRGGPVEERNRDVQGLRNSGRLNPESNLCFGEGGAGTYSDGKLYTRISDPGVRTIYEDLVAFGAPERILIEAHPHVGTNRLVKILKTIRRHLIAGGCQFHFNSRVVSLLQSRSGRVCGVGIEDGQEMTASAVILATGHSARDVYRYLDGLGVPMARKAFAIGARVEHPQALIDGIQYGPHAGHPLLEAATYALTGRVGSRGVYSFCMCPGGYVIPTTTDINRLNVNGMSNARRGSPFANAALVTTVEPGDFWIADPGDLDGAGALAGIGLQEHLESLAYVAGGGGYAAPAQRITDFLENRGGDLPSESSYRPRLTPADMRAVLPHRITQAISRALLHFDRKLRGYITADAVMIGAETTTSSPVRILRDPTTFESPGFSGLYPCGEGAGYAGGIVSSALDGMRVAQALASQ